MKKIFCDICGHRIAASRTHSRRIVETAFQNQGVRELRITSEINFKDSSLTDPARPDFCDKCFRELINEALLGAGEAE